MTSSSALTKKHTIVLGNEKGGSGKTTTAMHIVASILNEGFKVGSIDLDGRQRSLTRYVENRKTWSEANDVPLALPDHRVIEKSVLDTVKDQERDERDRFERVYAELMTNNDVVVIDSPGADSFLSRLGHAVADTIVTPMNDSFVDFDLLAQVNPETYEVSRPSLYAEMVWESRKRRAMADGGTIDWVIMRNRLSSLDAKNKRRVELGLEALSQRVGFRIAPGFGERVIFREMFPSGLTLLDLKSSGNGLSMSHVAARSEVRQLLATLQLPFLEEQAPVSAAS